MVIKLKPPTKKQAQFLKMKAKYNCYGGSRGGGKSFAVREKASLMAFRYPKIEMLIIRKTYAELNGNHIRPLMEMLKGAVVYNKQEKTMFFPNGSKIIFGYLDSENDIMRYQGQEYDIIFIDEATHICEEHFHKLKACLRGTNSFPKRMYLTCNPGGIGHQWVKRIFVDRNFKKGEYPEEYDFIKATVYDNEPLMKAQPDYVKQLEALPEKQRKAWLDGDWDIYEGQYFEEFTDDKEHYIDRRYTHVIEPFEIPGHWKIYRSFDFGYAKPFSCAWWACDEDGRLYRILELYGCTKDANTGVKWEPNKIFEEIHKVEAEHRWLKGKSIYGIADPSIWDESRGESIAETAEKHRVYFEPGDNTRLAGWMQMRYRFVFDENGIPMMYVFNTCKGFIRTIPLLQYDDKKVEDLDTSGEDHIADETRYMCMSRPIKARLPVEQKEILDDPLNLHKDMYNRYK